VITEATQYLALLHQLVVVLVVLLLVESSTALQVVLAVVLDKAELLVLVVLALQIKGALVVTTFKAGLMAAVAAVAHLLSVVMEAAQTAVMAVTVSLLRSQVPQ
jgi:hypothetical protein